MPAVCALAHCCPSPAFEGVGVGVPCSSGRAVVGVSGLLVGRVGEPSLGLVGVGWTGMGGLALAALAWVGLHGFGLRALGSNRPGERTPHRQP